MKIVTWNVNGIRACYQKGFLDFFNSVNADIFCIQETKMHEGQLLLDLPGYAQIFHSATKRGYSGTAIFTKKDPVSLRYDFSENSLNGPRKNVNLDETLEAMLNAEGRVITADYGDFYLVNAYVPNSQRELTRLPQRQLWEDVLRTHLSSLDLEKPVIYCGDLNVAHQPIDLANPRSNENNAGYTRQERDKISELLASGFTDVYRFLYPETVGYTWWSYMRGAREKNIGWRIDYFIVSNRFAAKVIDCQLCPDIFGSDHCPIVLTF